MPFREPRYQYGKSWLLHIVVGDKHTSWFVTGVADTFSAFAAAAVPGLWDICYRCVDSEDKKGPVVWTRRRVMRTLHHVSCQLPPPVKHVMITNHEFRGDDAFIFLRSRSVDAAKAENTFAESCPCRKNDDESSINFMSPCNQQNSLWWTQSWCTVNECNVLDSLFTHEIGFMCLTQGLALAVTHSQEPLTGIVHREIAVHDSTELL